MRTTPKSWDYAAQWVIANMVAWTLAMAIGMIRDMANSHTTLWLAADGIIIGAAEWLALSRRFSISGWWALGFGVGWGIALKAGWHFGFFVPSVFWLGCGGGVFVGVQQWLVLRRHIERAIIWIPAFIASSCIGTWAGEVAGSAYYNHTSNENMAYVIGGACVGAAVGLLSSLPLVWLLTRRA